jgi:two-component system sensor histidine kinase UhpB
MSERPIDFPRDEGSMANSMACSFEAPLPPDPAGPAAVGEDVAALKKRLRELAGELVLACEAAREHLARELHDGVGPELTAARFALAGVQPSVTAKRDVCATEAFAIAQRSLEAACEASHRIVSDLHAPHFEGGIVGALAHWTHAFTERTGLRTSVVCAADVRLTQLPQGPALAVFRVAQEALSNVAKHALASCADVRIETDARYLTLIVRDDGRGIRRRRRSDRVRTVGFGLAGMRARCEAFDGSLRVVTRGAPASGSSKAFADGLPQGVGVGPGTTVRARFGWDAILEARDARADAGGLATRQAT